MKSYKIQITPGEHGHFGDEKRALILALQDLISQINNSNDIPESLILNRPIDTSGAYFRGTIEKAICPYS
jgi:hypothetical protein